MRPAPLARVLLIPCLLLGAAACRPSDPEAEIRRLVRERYFKDLGVSEEDPADWGALAPKLDRYSTRLTPERVEFLKGKAPAARRESRRAPALGSTYLIEDVALVRLSRLSAKAPQALMQDLLKLNRKGIRGLILDLRWNSGGSVETAVEIARMFVGGKKELFSVRGRDAKSSWVYRAEEKARVSDSLPLAVLVDRSTRGEAELLAGALGATGRAIVVGTRTRGRGARVESFPLSDGSMLRLTVGEFVLPGGHRIEGAGVSPHVAIPISRRHMRYINGFYSKNPESVPKNDPVAREAFRRIKGGGRKS